MPLNSFLLAFVVAQAPAQTSAPTAASLISKMFARYAGAKTFSGQIKTTQSARGVSVVTDTALAYERPAKIHLEQLQKGRQIKRSSTLVSDGVQWEYSKPEGLFGQTKYLREDVMPKGGPSQTIGNFYATVGSNLPDRSPVLDTIIARTEDLKHFMDGLVSFAYKGKAPLGNRVVHQIVGKARDHQIVGSDVNYSATNRIEDFELDLTDEGDIVRYVVTQTFNVPNPNPKPGAPVVQDETVVVTTVWDVVGSVGTIVVADAFKLPKS